MKNPVGGYSRYSSVQIGLFWAVKAMYGCLRSKVARAGRGQRLLAEISRCRVTEERAGPPVVVHRGSLRAQQGEALGGRRGTVLASSEKSLSDVAPAQARSELLASFRGEQSVNENQGKLPLGEDPSDLVDIEWVAKRLGVTPRFVRRLVTERRIAYIKVGGLVRFEPVEVQRFIDKGRRPESA